MDEPLPLLPGEDADTHSGAGTPGGRTYLFDAILQPHTSLSPHGFMLLMVAVVAVSFVAGMAFLLMGAWPVFGFFGLDVALVYLAFKANYRWARMYETLRLTRDALLVERISPSGKVQRWRFQPYWLRVDVEDADSHDSRLVLSSHGRRLRIGAFLTPDERIELARALRDALAAARASDPADEPSADRMSVTA